MPMCKSRSSSSCSSFLVPVKQCATAGAVRVCCLRQSKPHMVRTAPLILISASACKISTEHVFGKGTSGWQQSENLRLDNGGTEACAALPPTSPGSGHFLSDHASFTSSSMMNLSLVSMRQLSANQPLCITTCLLIEPVLLDVPRTEITVEVQTALSNSHTLGICSELPESR